MVHQPIAIDCAGTDGRAEGAGGAEPGLSTDYGGAGAPTEQTAVPSADTFYGIMEVHQPLLSWCSSLEELYTRAKIKKK